MSHGDFDDSHWRDCNPSMLGYDIKSRKKYPRTGRELHRCELLINAPDSPLAVIHLFSGLECWTAQKAARDTWGSGRRGLILSACAAFPAVTPRCNAPQLSAATSAARPLPQTPIFVQTGHKAPSCSEKCRGTRPKLLHMTTDPQTLSRASIAGLRLRTSTRGSPALMKADPTAVGSHVQRYRIIPSVNTSATKILK